MKRGDIYLADLGDPIGHEQGLVRPVIIISSQPWLDSHPPVVTVIPVTRTFRGRATHVEIEPRDSGLRATSYIKCEDVRAVSPERLRTALGELDALALARVEVILRRLIGL